MADGADEPPVVLGVTEYAPWQYGEVVEALYFFAMDAGRLQAWLPPPFEPMWFDGPFPMCSGHPLATLTAYHGWSLGLGCRWDEWAAPADAVAAIPGLFEALRRQVERLQAAIADDAPPARTFDRDDWRAAHESVREAARVLLARIGWDDPDLGPFRSAREMLSAFSSGAFDEHVPPVDPR